MPDKPACFIPLMGGLGNQLFQIAAAFAHCKRNGLTPVISEGTQGGRPTYWDRTLYRARRYIGTPSGTSNLWREPHFHYHPIPSSARYLFGYYQSSKYFSDYRDEIRELFAPPPSLVTAVDAKYGSLITPHSVAVHVRRGDYLTGGRPAFHYVTTERYFERAVEEARRRDPEAHFVVFSEDVDWCRAQPFFAGATIVDESDECLTFELLSRFRRYIISNSSFSWWATWLGPAPEMVLAPDRWFGPAGPQDWEDIYEPSWIKIKTD
jgi:hypothetical protein